MSEKIRYVHFIGCGGAGTCPLALIFHEKGYICSGSDLISCANTEKLQAAGVSVISGPHKAENLSPELTKDNALVVYTSAAAEDNPELTEAKRRGISCVRRGEALAHIAREFPVTVGVAGSHGKTSVTSLLVHALRTLGYEPGFLIGGTMTGLSVSGTAGKGKIFVTEVDESDSTNALFHASIAVVTNVEDDHSWSVGGTEKLYESFRTFAKQSAKLVYVPGGEQDRIFGEFRDKSVSVPYVRAELFPNTWGGFQKQNGMTAWIVLRQLLPREQPERLLAVLQSFPGVERRLSLRFENETFRLIEDYAHHPTELRASISALRETNPGRRLVVVFQPHRYARLKRYLPEFAAELKKADRVFIMPVFAAWTSQSDITSADLVSAIGDSASLAEGTPEEIAATVRHELRKGDLAAVIGAGDIHALIPLIGR